MSEYRVRAGNGVELIGGFPGSAPFCKGSCQSVNDDEFRIAVSFSPKTSPALPESVGRAHRLTLKLNNPFSEVSNIKVLIDHKDISGRSLAYRNSYYTSHGDDNAWDLVPAPVRDGISYLSLCLNTGETVLADSPAYSNARLGSYIESIRDSAITEEFNYGRSEAGLLLKGLRISDPAYSNFSRQSCLVISRNHAYETGGNFCLEGMIDFLLSRSQISDFYLSQFDFVFLPITNPDGVEYGLTRLTSSNGADLNRVFTKKDAAHTNLINFIKDNPPDLFINLHNWQSKFSDGILCNEHRFGELVDNLLPSGSADFKIRHIMSSEDWLSKQGFKSHAELTAEKGEGWKSLKNLIKDIKSSCNSVVLEFPWYGRSTDRMRQLGVESLQACVHADMHYRMEIEGNIL